MPGTKAGAVESSTVAAQSPGGSLARPMLPMGIAAVVVPGVVSPVGTASASPMTGPGPATSDMSTPIGCWLSEASKAAGLPKLLRLALLKLTWASGSHTSPGASRSPPHHSERAVASAEPESSALHEDAAAQSSGASPKLGAASCWTPRSSASQEEAATQSSGVSPMLETASYWTPEESAIQQEAAAQSPGASPMLGTASSWTPGGSQAYASTTQLEAPEASANSAALRSTPRENRSSGSPSATWPDGCLAHCLAPGPAFRGAPHAA
eukprot:CAMPEP_0180804340 /NCGR_PEP_ID=MMETSP1038_2-20121128/61405_1 /TAXON_ID=632150 /ORGANISM="Azadinium spinosum, Strain 3D9" /LENGTH=266 /DNA_ID=CAMNT_0022844769 /DNA_START=214 /DNA_END=1010 /DNA_ORIENTATION=-